MSLSVSQLPYSPTRGHLCHHHMVMGRKSNDIFHIISKICSTVAYCPLPNIQEIELLKILSFHQLLNNDESLLLRSVSQKRQVTGIHIFGESRPACCGNVSKEKDFVHSNETQPSSAYRVEFGQGSRGLTIYGRQMGARQFRHTYIHGYVYVHTQVSIYLLALVLYYLLLCVCAGTCLLQCMYRAQRVDLESQFPPSTMVSKDWTQVNSFHLLSLQS